MFTASCPDCGHKLKNWQQACPVCIVPDTILEAGMIGHFYGVDNNCFKLNDTVFEVLEDEEDGYRSSMEDVVARTDTDGLVFSKAPFAQVTVREVDTGTFRGWELFDSKGHVWLKFGTDEYDDYYPTFFFQYQPSGQLVSEWKPKPVTPVTYKKPVKVVKPVKLNAAGFVAKDEPVKEQFVVIRVPKKVEPDQPTGRKFKQDI